MLRAMRFSCSKRVLFHSYVEIKDTLISTIMDQGPAKRQREVFDCQIVSSYADYDVHKGGKWSAAWIDNHDYYEQAWDDIHSIDDSLDVEERSKSLDHSEISFKDKTQTLDATPEFYVCENEVRTNDGVEKMCGKYCCTDRTEECLPSL